MIWPYVYVAVVSKFRINCPATGWKCSEGLLLVAATIDGSYVDFENETAYDTSRYVLYVTIRRYARKYVASLTKVLESREPLRERERDLREETVYCSPAWDCGKGSLV